MSDEEALLQMLRSSPGATLRELAFRLMSTDRFREWSEDDLVLVLGRLAWGEA